MKNAIYLLQRDWDNKRRIESGGFKVNKGFAQSIGVTRPVLALSVARMADAMGNSILFIIVPLYVAKIPAEYLHFPLPVLVGILLSLYGLVNSVLQPFTGALSDLIGRRKALILIGLGLMCAGTIGFIPATNFLQLVGLRMLQGIGVAITIPASMAIMAAVTVKETRGGAMGVYSTLRVIGFAVGPLVGGFSKVIWGFSAAFFIGAGFIALAMVLVHFWVNEVEAPPKSFRARPFKIWDRELMHLGILSAAAAVFIMSLAFSMVTTLENEFNIRLDISALGFSVAFSSVMAGRLLFQVPLGRLSDSVGRKPIIILGLLFIAPITGLMGEVTTLWQFIFLRGLTGDSDCGHCRTGLCRSRGPFTSRRRRPSDESHHPGVRPGNGPGPDDRRCSRSRVFRSALSDGRCHGTRGRLDRSQVYARNRKIPQISWTPFLIIHKSQSL